MAADPYPPFSVTLDNGYVLTFRVGQRVQINIPPRIYPERVSMYNFLWGTIIEIMQCTRHPACRVVLDTEALYYLDGLSPQTLSVQQGTMRSGMYCMSMQ